MYVSRDTEARSGIIVAVHVDLHIQHPTHMRHIVTSFVVPQSIPYFSTLSHKWCDFRGGGELLNIKYVF